MLTDPNKFEVNIDGLKYAVIRSANDTNVYRLKSEYGTYLLAKDFYNVWIELTKSTSAPNISSASAGQQIDNHFKVKQASV